MGGKVGESRGVAAEGGKVFEVLKGLGKLGKMTPESHPQNVATRRACVIWGKACSKGRKPDGISDLQQTGGEAPPDTAGK